MRYLLATSVVLFLFSCKKDCLEKGKCMPSNYVSVFVVEQVLPTATGVIYYVDNELGKKGNNGQSIDSPFKTIKQLQKIEFKPGDQILFRRGQYHIGELELKQSGTATNRIYISAYGAGFMPIVKSEDGSKLKSNKKTIFLNQANYVSVFNLNIHGGEHAVQLSNSNNFVIAGCRIGENSSSGLRATGEYSEGNGSNFGEIHHCLLYSGVEGNLGDRQSTDGIQLMDGASNWYIYNNEFKAWSHSAMSIKQLYNLKANNNNLIEQNLFDCSDIDYMRALDITGGDHLVEFNVFQKNRIKNQTVTSHLHGNDNTMAYNVFESLQPTTASEQHWAIDLHVITSQVGTKERDKLVCYNNKVYNNVFYNFENGIGVRVLNRKSGAQNIVHDNAIVNNIFYNVTTAIEIDNEPENITISNNMFYTVPTIIKHSGVTYNLIDYQIVYVNSVGNMEADPLFVNSQNLNFHLQIGSPAINSGLDVMLVSDFENNLILDTPDIGAFEF